MTTIRDHDLLLLVTCSLYRFRVSISAISAVTIRAVNINQIESDLKKPGWGGWGTLCGHCAVIISRICFQYLTKYWCLWPHVSRWRAILSLAPARPQTHNWNQPSLSKLLTNKLGMVLELLDLDLLSPPPPTSSAHILRWDISNFEAKSQSQIFGLNSPSLSSLVQDLWNKRHLYGNMIFRIFDSLLLSQHQFVIKTFPRESRVSWLTAAWPLPEH